MTADITIRNARIIDGSGAPTFDGDLEITGDRITQVGRAGAGTREIDAHGLTLAPGFVDTHSHDDGAFLRYPGMEFKLAQGVTSEVSGNCGFSTIPNEPGRTFMPGDIVSGSHSTWTDLDGYYAACQAA
jgi:N-acyl-D-amino-acid deacylase